MDAKVKSEQTIFGYLGHEYGKSALNRFTRLTALVFWHVAAIT